MCLSAERFWDYIWRFSIIQTTFSFNLSQQWDLRHPWGAFSSIHHPHKHRRLQENSQTSCLMGPRRIIHIQLQQTEQLASTVLSTHLTAVWTLFARASPINSLLGLHNFFWALFHASVQFGFSHLCRIVSVNCWDWTFGEGAGGGWGVWKRGNNMCI